MLRTIKLLLPEDKLFIETSRMLRKTTHKQCNSSEDKIFNMYRNNKEAYKFVNEKNFTMLVEKNG